MPGFFPADPKQALRLRRALMAVAASAVLTAVCVVCLKMGWFRGTTRDFYILFGVMWAFIVLMALTIRLGLNLRFPDPSLTLAQMGPATFFLMVVVYFIPDLRLVFIMLYLVVLLFGAFRLRLGEFFFITALAGMGYGLVIYLWSIEPGGARDVTIRLFELFGFVLMSLTFSLIGSELSRLRRTVRRQHRDLECAFQTIQEQAVTDELTGAHNRRFIMDVLTREKDLALRGGHTFSILYLDLDRFKSINDVYGHASGDLVLKRFARIVRGAIRGVDYLARMGGEEFLVLLTQSRLDGARNVAERIRLQMEATGWADINPVLKVTVSIGATEYQPYDRIEDLLQRADQALYEAKEQGRNRVMTA
jgi:diguanylate cyclase (GGDEF)-like protein